jgi:hypothetical protein
MSLKKFDLAKNMGLKINGQLKNSGVPDRFAQGAALPDRREQRRLDAAAGLVPFACKLPAELVRELQQQAEGQEGGVNALLARLLKEGLAAAK